MNLVTYIVGFHFLMYAVNGTADNFIATIYGPLPVPNAMALATERNGGTPTGVGEWTWRVAPNLTDPQAPALPLQALEDSAVIQFKSLGKRTLHSMNCALLDSSYHANFVSETYRCDHFR